MRSSSLCISPNIPISLAHENYFNIALLRNANCIIDLHDPVTISGLYGIRKTTTSIALSIDDVKRFVAEVSAAMNVRTTPSPEREL